MHWNNLFKDVSMLSCWEVLSFEELVVNFSCKNPVEAIIAILAASSSGTGTASSSSSSWASASKSETIKWPECMVSRESLPLFSFLPVAGRWKLWLDVVVIIVNGFLYTSSACIPLQRHSADHSRVDTHFHAHFSFFKFSFFSLILLLLLFFFLIRIACFSLASDLFSIINFLRWILLEIDIIASIQNLKVLR